MNNKSISSTLSADCVSKSNVQKYITALTLGVLSVGFTSSAIAISTFDGSAALTITLDSVTDVQGAAVDAAGNWSVIAEGFEDAALTSVVGDAAATINNTIAPYAGLNIGDGVSQASHSSGSATNGSSSADSLTSLYIDVENTYEGGSLNFNFSFEAMAAATVVGGTTIADFAGSAVLVFDDLGFDYVDIFTDVSIDGVDNPGLLTGSFGFELMDADVNTISAFVDSYGAISATAPPPPPSAVPVPAAVWLFGSGLIGLVGVARRKKK